MGYEFSAVTGFTTTPSIRAPSEHLLVTRLDRLARSTRDLLNIVHAVGERGAAFKSLADAWADTHYTARQADADHLGGLAEFERSLISARTAAGRARAKANGVRFGRRPKLNAREIAPEGL